MRSELALRDRLGGLLVRLDVGRERYAVPAGLYALGSPDAAAPVVVTANYKLTFDVVRRALAGRSLWLLVLETHGINVWCAAGKGTFGTDELVRRLQITRLDEIVSHRRLLLPIFGATGVCAPEVKRRTGFAPTFAAVRVTDLPHHLDHGGETTALMRAPTFTVLERLTLTPVELVGGFKAALPLFALVAIIGAFTGGSPVGGALYGVGALALAIIAGSFATPILLPWIPGRSFAFKGALLGAVVTAAYLATGDPTRHWHAIAAHLLLLVPVSSFAALGFTGCTPFTSPSGVKKEMRVALPLFLASVVLGAVAFGLGLGGA
ncbi:MAG: acetyl-CoA synthase subunit gamma [Deltaproteobacteria bacterium]|nr:acetyl-CoA synthase subunit gamma [Deltaproteobacteria bacterium]